MRIAIIYKTVRWKEQFMREMIENNQCERIHKDILVIDEVVYEFIQSSAMRHTRPDEVYFPHDLEWDEFMYAYGYCISCWHDPIVVKDYKDYIEKHRVRAYDYYRLREMFL